MTAGSTLEWIDEVRVWGNIFTGQTGLAIAMELARIEGAKVELLTSNSDHALRFTHENDAQRCSAATFRTHADLRAALEERIRDHSCEGIFMTAAVADYRPAGVFEVISRDADRGAEERWVVRRAQAAKVKSHFGRIAVLGERTEKLIDLFRGAWGHRGLLVKFKLEVGIDASTLLDIAKASRRESDADYMVANTLEMVQGPEPGAFLINRDDVAEFVRRPELAGRLARIAADGHHASRPGA